MSGPLSLTGVVGTTSNGVTYLSMSFFFALSTRLYRRGAGQCAACQGREYGGLGYETSYGPLIVFMGLAGGWGVVFRFGWKSMLRL
jgi:hypothetical protein